MLSGQRVYASTKTQASDYKEVKCRLVIKCQPEGNLREALYRFCATLLCKANCVIQSEILVSRGRTEKGGWTPGVLSSLFQSRDFVDRKFLSFRGAPSLHSLIYMCIFIDKHIQ